MARGGTVLPLSLSLILSDVYPFSFSAAVDDDNDDDADDDLHGHREETHEVGKSVKWLPISAGLFGTTRSCLVRLIV